MTTILIRTLIIYVALILTMRLMGKRQIGELEVTDLVTTLLISEIASLPITNPEIPVLHAMIPMTVLLILEIFSSVILIRIPWLKNTVSARPTVIIQGGRLRQKALRDLRMSLDELMSEIRQQGLTDLAQVEDAILEKNGNLTVLPKAEFSPPTAAHLGIRGKDGGLMHIVYCNGTYSRVGLSLIGKDRDWLTRELRRRGLEARRLFCVTANSKGELFWLEKEETDK